MENSFPNPQQPLVSVVMVVYDPNPNYFRKSVESIVNQQCSDWELIIVETPSPRSASEILQEIPDSRIRHFVNSQGTSLVEQRNRAFQEARGHFIALMDADDIAHPFRLTKQINFLRNHPNIDVIGSQVGVIDSEDRISGYRWFPSLHEDIRRSIVQVVPLCQPAVMLRREVVDRLGGYQFTAFAVGEDYEYWSRLLRAGVRFANLPDVLLYYRLHPSQLKQSKLDETIRAVLHVRKLYWSDRIDYRARLRIWGEHVLLYMPKRLVAWFLLKVRWHYKSSPMAPRVWPTRAAKTLIKVDA